MKMRVINNLSDFIVTVVFVLFSCIAGIISGDLLIGGGVLATGLISTYYASIGNRMNYIISFINYILMGYVAWKNDLYGLFFFNLFVFAPLEIQGFISWKKNMDTKKRVLVREFTFQNSIIVMSSCIIGSLVIGGLLGSIPGQRLAFLDAISNSINLCASILMILRYKESWWLLLLNNLADTFIWLITVRESGFASVMMLLVSIGFLIINVYGIIKWNSSMKKIYKIKNFQI